MRKALPALTVFLLLSGCGTSETSPSVLQRYDKMRRDLGWITHTSETVSNDVRKLQVPMSRGNVATVRAGAIRLKIDARQYSLRAGAAGNVIRALAQEAPTRTVRLYLQQVTLALSWEWVEGLALTHVADQAWLDPLSARAGSAQRLEIELRWAQKAADRAVRAAAAARSIKNHAQAEFRYSVVTPAS